MAGQWLQIKRGTQLVSNVHLGGERLVLGRAGDCDVVLNTEGVSRRHVELAAGDGAWTIRDLGSRNGFLVNGVRAKQDHRMRPGDRVQIDVFELVIKQDDPAPPRPGAQVPIADAADYGAARTMQQMAPPKLTAKHLDMLLSFSGDLLAACTLPDRRRRLCELMTGPDFHGSAALLLQVRRGDPEAAAEVVGEPVLGGAGEPPHLSRTLLQAVAAHEAAVLAASRPTLAAGGQDVVQLSVAAGARAAAIACPLRLSEASMEVLYVLLPGAYGTVEWLALANMACAQFRQAEEVWYAREAAQRQALLEEEQRHAQALQERLVPADFSRGRVDIGFGFAASKGVGGDYVDAVCMADGRVLLVAMDVAGKGMDAALIASGLHTTVHLCASLGLGLPEMVATLNRYLIHTWGTHTSVTVAASILDPRSGAIESLNCSHPDPVIVGVDGRVRELRAFETIPLGLIEFPLETWQDSLRPGELLAYYSDGLSELFNEADEMLGVDGVNRCLAELRGPPGADPGARVPALVARLHGRLAEHRGKADPSDDVSFILVQFEG